MAYHISPHRHFIVGLTGIQEASLFLSPFHECHHILKHKELSSVVVLAAWRLLCMCTSNTFVSDFSNSGLTWPVQVLTFH